MKNPVIAIGLDAADPILMEKWMSQGHLKNLNSLIKQGAYTSLTGLDYYKAETPWTNFLTGCVPQTTGYWGGIKLKENTYNVENIQAYDYQEYPPFYALGDDYRVAIFDPPKGTLSDSVNGIQVLAWGAHSPGTPSHSLPENILPELNQRHGKHPALHKDHGDWWDKAYLERLLKALKTGISRRVDICQDFLQQENWDLFLTVFSEPHSAGHDFWFMSQNDHPLYEYTHKNKIAEEPLLEVFEAVDNAIGEILTKAPENAHIVIFSVHGSDNNTTDVASMFLLGEFLYRWNFPGKVAIAPGKLGTTPPPPRLKPRRKTWAGEVWQLKHDPNLLRRWLRMSLPSKYHVYIDRFLGTSQQPDLASAQKLQAMSDPFYWQPVSWYKPFWSQMKAFALPSFSEGYIRINLKGREPEGIVEPAEYDAVCEELIQDLHKIINPRNGKPVVKQVIRTSQHTTEDKSKLPSADLIVEWEDTPTDVIDHPQCGRIGPVPYRRTGSHRSRGFLTIKSPNITPGSSLPKGDSIDIAPTILELMGAPIPEHLQGKSLLKVSNTISQE